MWKPSGFAKWRLLKLGSYVPRRLGDVPNLQVLTGTAGNCFSSLEFSQAGTSPLRLLETRLSVSLKLLEVKVEASSKGGSAEPGYLTWVRARIWPPDGSFPGRAVGHCWGRMLTDTLPPAPIPGPLSRMGRSPPYLPATWRSRSCTFRCVLCVCVWLFQEGGSVHFLLVPFVCKWEFCSLFWSFFHLPHTAAPAVFPLAVCLCVSIVWCFPSLCLRIENLGSCGPCEAVS